MHRISQHKTPQQKIAYNSKYSHVINSGNTTKIINKSQYKVHLTTDKIQT